MTEICPLVTAQRLLTGKWSIVILKELHKETLRFNALQKRLNGITASTLTKQLKYLEHEGLIERTVYPEVPLRVEYSLTYIGHLFNDVIDQLDVWSDAYEVYVKSLA